jgi:hypothetical protein
VDIRREALVLAQGAVEALTEAGTTTTVTSNAMRYRFSGDDVAGKGMRLYDPSDADADELRIANSWDDSAGTATVDALSAVKAGTETIEYYPRNDPGPYEYDDALNRALRDADRVVTTILPTVEGDRDYEFLNAPWIETKDDILNVLYRASPNMIDNPSFELWGRGVDSQLHGWTLAGGSSTVTRVDGTQGRFAVRISRSGNDVTLTQTISIPIIQLYSKSISIFARIKCSTASAAFVRVNDGTDTTDTSSHDGGGDWDEFTATHTVNADAVGPLTIELHLTTTNTNADFENIIAVEGSSVPEWLSKYGDQHQPTELIKYTPTNRGSLPVVVTEERRARGGQLVVQSRQHYFALSADSGAVGATDMPFEGAVAGTITKLAEVYGTSSPNAVKWQDLGARWEPVYNSYRRQLAEPAPNPTPNRASIGSA